MGYNTLNNNYWFKNWKNDQLNKSQNALKTYMNNYHPTNYEIEEEKESKRWKK